MTDVGTAKTISITLSPDLLAKARAYTGKEDLSISDLFDEGLRRYLVGNPEWDALLQRSRARAKEMGIETEEDVERLSDEYRREKYERTA